MKFLVETFDTCDVASEINEASGEKKYYIEGCFAQAEKRNRNNRVYPKKVLEAAIKNYMPMVESRRALGELNHPPHPNVNPERASHLIESLRWEGNDVIGRAKILTSLPMGKIAKGLIDEGVKFGVSTRGMGTMRESTVGSDYVLNTVDIVTDPSGIDCWVSGIMEGKEWVMDAVSGNWKLAEETYESVQAAKSQSIDEMVKSFQNFLRKIQ